MNRCHRERRWRLNKPGREEAEREKRHGDKVGTKKKEKKRKSKEREWEKREMQIEKDKRKSRRWR